MPGYAHPIETTVNQGSLKSISFTVNQTEATVPFYTATTKTRVSAVLASNTLGTILPVKLYIYRDSSALSFLASEVRVLSHKYMVQQLVSGDLRVDDKDSQEVGRHKVITDFVLGVGDKLMAECPIAGAIVLTVSLEEGI
jgi:hypothetical protein